jgi:hypothetical protein
MDGLQRFVCEGNVAHFRDRLKYEASPPRRIVLLDLLIAEEDKLGLDLEQLASVEREIARCKDLIVRQGRLIGELQEGGHGTAQADALLETLTETLAVHETHRGRICDCLERNRL